IRRSSSSPCSGVAPFCGAKSRGASRSGASVSQKTVVGAGSSGSVSRRPAPPSIVAVPPRQTSSRSASTRAISSPSPRLEAACGSRRAGSSGITSAASTSAAPSASARIGASRGRPNASGTETRATTRAPSVSPVPSPPSAIGSSSASAPPARSPSARTAAASRAERTPLRLAGDASARTLGGRNLFLGDLDRLRSGHHPQHRKREPFPRQEEHPHADADRRLDRLKAEAEGDPARLCDTVGDQRQRDGGLDQPDVAGPEREDRGYVDKDEHERRGGKPRIDVERAHRAED